MDKRYEELLRMGAIHDIAFRFVTGNVRLFGIGKGRSPFTPDCAGMEIAAKIAIATRGAL